MASSSTILRPVAIDAMPAAARAADLLSRLVKKVARAFYEPRYIVVLDYILDASLYV